MEKQLQEILNTLYEAEGLLEMALRRAPRNLDALAALAREKCFHAADLAAALQVNEDNSEPAVENAEEAADSKPVDAVNEPDVAEQLFVERVVPKLSAEPSVHEPEREENEAGDAVAELQSERLQEAEREESLLAEAPEESAMEIDEDDEQLAEAQEFEQEQEAEQEPEPIVATRPRKPVATFFSINDKFRFRRELFGGSNPEWLDALALLETMADMNEASDYLLDDLQWDPESLDVKAFMQILERYYNS